MKVAIYARVSTAKQTAESQLEPCLEFCKKHKLDVYDSFIDTDKSAYHNVKRKAYEKVKFLVQTGEIDGVVVWAFDRWTRRGPKDMRGTFQFFDFHNATIYSVKEYWVEKISDMGSIGEVVKPLLYDLFAWMAEQESIRRSERVKTSEKFQKAKKKGKVGRPGISNEARQQVIKLLKEGKSYSFIHNIVTYKAKYGKIKHVSKSTIGEIKQSLSEKGYKEKQG